MTLPLRLVLFLAALVALASAGPAVRPAEAPGTEPSPFAGAAPAWEVPLDATPTAPPRVLATGDGDVVVLERGNGIEARAVSDGAMLWNRVDLSVTGLGHVATETDGRLVASWSGLGESGTPVLLRLAPRTGATLAVHDLPASPVGPPVHVEWPEGDAWLVPLEDGVIAAVAPSGNEVSPLAVEPPLRPPLFVAFGRPLGVAGDPPALRDIASRPRRTLAPEIEPRTVAVSGPWLVAASDGGVCGHACRVTRRGRLRCKRRWCQVLGAPTVAPPLLADGLAVAGSLDTFVYAFDLENGHLVWRTREGQRLAHAALPWRGLALFIPVSGRRISAIDVADGRPIGAIPAGPGESFSGGGALSGDTVVTVVERPPDVVLLRAYALPGAQESATQPRAGASTPSPRSAARKRSSSMR